MMKILNELPIERIRKFFPAAAFFCGFAWDSLTLTRIDLLIDNVILLVYLALLGGLIVLINLIEGGSIRHSFLLRFKKWYPFAMQFLFGGLFSAYVVYYFKSASFSQPNVFLLLLAVLLVANEFLENRMTNIYLQVTMYFLVAVSFFIFFVPIVVKSTNFYTFLAGGVIGVIGVEGLVVLLHRMSVFRQPREYTVCRGIPPALLLLLIVFYTANWIPPVPLSLKFSGMYHKVAKTEIPAGTRYTLSYEKPPWYRPWKKSDDVFYIEGVTEIYCFSAVFATTDLTASIFHRWQRYDNERGEWLTADNIELPIRGGRDDGYRLYSHKTNIVPGSWRVEVRTAGNALLGRLEFEIQTGGGVPELASVIR